MAAIIPAIDIDSEKSASRYFLIYQVAWIFDTARMMLAEKSSDLILGNTPLPPEPVEFYRKPKMP